MPCLGNILAPMVTISAFGQLGAVEEPSIEERVQALKEEHAASGQSSSNAVREAEQSHQGQQYTLNVSAVLVAGAVVGGIFLLWLVMSLSAGAGRQTRVNTSPPRKIGNPLDGKTE